LRRGGKSSASKRKRPDSLDAYDLVLLRAIPHVYPATAPKRPSRASRYWRGRSRLQADYARRPRFCSRGAMKLCSCAPGTAKKIGWRPFAMPVQPLLMVATVRRRWGLGGFRRRDGGARSSPLPSRRSNRPSRLRPFFRFDTHGGCRLRWPMAARPSAPLIMASARASTEPRSRPRELLLASPPLSIAFFPDWTIRGGGQTPPVRAIQFRS